MIIHIPDVLSAEQVAHARRLLNEATWVDGRVTAGAQAARAKDNMQLAEDDPVAARIGDQMIQTNHPLWVMSRPPPSGSVISMASSPD